MTSNLSKDAKILVVGNDDVIEWGIFQFFQNKGFQNTVASSRIGLDATIQSSVYAFFQFERPDYVILSSTCSGGLGANQTFPADFIYHNSESQNNIIYASWKFQVKKLIYLAAPCVYSKDAVVPFREEVLFTGFPVSASLPYAVAKISGIQMCEAFNRQYGLETVSVIPAAVYGPFRDADVKRSQVMAALTGQFLEAVRERYPVVNLWGAGDARREFIYIDDLVEAIATLISIPTTRNIVNVGSGMVVSIRELATLIAEVTGFQGEIQWDPSMSEGAKEQSLDSSRMNALGWQARVALREGVVRCVNFLREDKE